MKKKIIVLSCVFILMATLAIGGFLGFRKIKFLADSGVSQYSASEIATLANANNNPNSDMPVIQLDYDKATIEVAIFDYQNTKLADLKSLSDQDKQVKDSLDQKINSLRSSSKPNDSTAFVLLDKTGQKVNQNPAKTSVSSKSTTSVSSANITNVADNFDFDPSLSQTVKQTLLDAYPKIEALYGKRSNNKAIKVTPDGKTACPYGRGACFDPEANQISISNSSYVDMPVYTHELIHAFHGSYCVGPLWEEGETELATEIIMKGGLSYAKSIETEVSGLPFYSFAETGSVANADPYTWGSATLAKVYVENNNFFVNFNAKLYDYAQNHSDYYNSSVLVGLLSQAVPKVENEPTFQWLSHQYPFTSYTNSNPDTTILPSAMVNYKVTDFQGKILVNCNATEENLTNNVGISQCDFKVSPNYTGIIKETKTPLTGDTSNRRIIYTPYFNGLISAKIVSNSVHGAFIGSATAAFVTATNLDTGKSEKVKLINGVFKFSEQGITSGQGRYKVEATSLINTCTRGVPHYCYDRIITIGTEYFNKLNGGYTVMLNDRSSMSCPLTVQTKSYNRSISLQITGNNYCGHVILLNNIPIERTWAKNETITLSNLDKNTSYKIAVYSAPGHIGSYAYSSTATTTAFDDFTISKVENIGNVSDRTFKRRYTFSTAYDATALSKISMALADKDILAQGQVPIMINKIDSKTFDIIPKNKLYNNGQYVVSGLNLLTDTHGIPIILKGDDLLKYSYFLTPPTVDKTKLPSYDLVSDTISLTGNVQIKMTNFSTADMVPRTFIVRNTQLPNNCPKGEEDQCAVINAKVSYAGNLITLAFPNGLTLDNTYSVQAPAFIDSNNNIIQEKLLLFSVVNNFSIKAVDSSGKELVKIISGQSAGSYSVDLNQTFELIVTWAGTVPKVGSAVISYPNGGNLIQQNTGTSGTGGRYIFRMTGYGVTDIKINFKDSISGAEYNRTVSVIASKG